MNRIWFHRSRAIGWVILGAVAFLFGWQDSIVLIWLASVYANVESAWSTAEATDDSDLIDRLERIERLLDDRRCSCYCSHKGTGGPED